MPARCSVAQAHASNTKMKELHTLIAGHIGFPQPLIFHGPQIPSRLTRTCSLYQRGALVLEVNIRRSPGMATQHLQGGFRSDYASLRVGAPGSPSVQLHAWHPTHAMVPWGA